MIRCHGVNNDTIVLGARLPPPPSPSIYIYTFRRMNIHSPDEVTQACVHHVHTPMHEVVQRMQRQALHQWSRSVITDGFRHFDSRKRRGRRWPRLTASIPMIRETCRITGFQLTRQLLPALSPCSPSPSLSLLMRPGPAVAVAQERAVTVANCSANCVDYARRHRESDTPPPTESWLPTAVLPSGIKEMPPRVLRSFRRLCTIILCVVLSLSPNPRSLSSPNGGAFTYNSFLSPSQSL